MMVRIRTFVLALALLSSPPALADGPNLWVEAVAQRSQHGKGVTETLAWVDGNIRGPVGYFVFAYAASDGYREIYGGPTIRPVPWLELGIGLGRETDGNHRRRSAHFSADGEIGSISGYFENGASGPAHKVYLNYWLTRTLGIGLMDTDTGRGPRVVIPLGEKANIWGAVLRDRSTHETSSVFAVNYQF